MTSCWDEAWSQPPLKLWILIGASVLVCFLIGLKWYPNGHSKSQILLLYRSQLHIYPVLCRSADSGRFPRYYWSILSIQLSDWLGMPALRLSDGSLCHLLSLIPSLRDPETSCSALASSCGQSLHVELKPQTSRKRKALRNCQGWLLSIFLSVVHYYIIRVALVCCSFTVHW